jgi:hypothetical protein
MFAVRKATVKTIANAITNSQAGLSAVNLEWIVKS